MKILFIAPLPPPVHGSAMVSQYIKDSKLVNEQFDCDFVNLSTSRCMNEGDPVGRSLKKIYQSHPDLVGFRKYLSHWHKMRASTAIRYDERHETLKEVCLSLKYTPFNYKVAMLGVLALLPHRLREFIIHRS